jgi:hypothetical protein
MFVLRAFASCLPAEIKQWWRSVKCTGGTDVLLIKPLAKFWPTVENGVSLQQAKIPAESVQVVQSFA